MLLLNPNHQCLLGSSSAFFSFQFAFPWDNSHFSQLYPLRHKWILNPRLYTRRFPSFIYLPTRHLYMNGTQKLPTQNVQSCCVHPSPIWTFPVFPTITNDITIHPVARTRTSDHPGYLTILWTSCPIAKSYWFYLWNIIWVYPPFSFSPWLTVTATSLKKMLLAWHLQCIAFLLFFWFGVLCSPAVLTDSGNSAFSKIQID